jgi:hypothetical protein
MDLDFGGRELGTRYAPGLSGPNFVVAVKLVNHELDRVLGISPGKRGTLKQEEFVRGVQSLPEVLDRLTGRVRKAMQEDKSDS